MQEDQFKRITRELETERRNHKQVSVFFVRKIALSMTQI